MISERDTEFWEDISGTYSSDDQGDAPRRIVDSLLESGAVRPDDCVMEIGSGPGTYSLPLAQRVRILVCMDSSEGMLERLGASAAGMGIGNIERFHKDWSTYVPRKGYDFCLATLLPGSASDDSMRRMEGTARRGCAVLAWERLGWDDVTTSVSYSLGLERHGPVRGTEFFEDWLSCNRRDFSIERFPIGLTREIPLEKAVESECAKFRAFGIIDGVEDAVKDALSPYTDGGMVRFETENVLRMVRWLCEKSE